MWTTLDPQPLTLGGERPAYDGPMMDRHPDGSQRIALMDGNTVRLHAARDGRTRLSIFGPAGGHHATVRLTQTEVNHMVAALAMSAVEGDRSHEYRDAMTP
jgi:hypothetical protein